MTTTPEKLTFTAGLNGLEDIVYIGWPFHGRVLGMTELYASNNTPRPTGIDGHDIDFSESTNIPGIGSANRLDGRASVKDDNHFVLRLAQPEPWHYCIINTAPRLLPLKVRSLDPVTLEPVIKTHYLYREMPGMPSSIGALHSIYPVELPGGEQVAAGVSAGMLDGAPSIVVYVGNGIGAARHSAGAMTDSGIYDIDRLKIQSISSDYTSMSGRVMTTRHWDSDYGQVWYVPSASSSGVFAPRLLDYRSNKLLIGLQLLGDGQVIEEDVLGGKAHIKNFRGHSTGSSAYMAWDAGWENLHSIYEIEFNGIEPDNITITRLKAPTDCEGATSRASPTETNKQFDSNNKLIRETYEWSMTQDGCVIDAHYDDEGEVVYRAYSANHSFSGEQIENEHGKKDSTFVMRSTISFEGESISFEQRVTQNETITKDLVVNTIKLNGVTIRTDTLDTSDHGTFRASPLSFNNSGDRAPFPGVDARCGAYGMGFWYPSLGSEWNMHTYSLALRNSGAGTIILSGTIDQFLFNDNASPAAKQKYITESYIFGRQSKVTQPPITDIIKYGDSRYSHAGLSDPVDLSNRRGCLAERVNGVINQYTNEYHAGDMTNPMARSLWL